MEEKDRLIQEGRIKDKMLRSIIAKTGRRPENDQIAEICAIITNGLLKVNDMVFNIAIDALPFEKVTRLEIINHRHESDEGRVYVHRKPDNKIEGSLQDDGKTLKIFITKR